MKTYVNVDPGNVEGFRGGVLAGRETVELMPATVPLERVKGRLLEIVMAAQHRLLTTLHCLRNYFQADIPQAARTFVGNENRNGALSLVCIISPLLLLAPEVAQHASARNCNSTE